LDIVPGPRGIGLKGRLDQVSALGLPVLISGGASADFLVGQNGLTGNFDFDELRVRDVEKLERFGAINVKGGGVIAGNQISILAQALEPATNIKLADITLGHDIALGSGSLDVQAIDLRFSPNVVAGRQGLELAALLPPLRGVVTDMEGRVDATANFNWTRDASIRSSATIETTDLDFLIELGPVSGVSGAIKFDDLLNARTAGPQTVKVGLLNTGGIPIENGTVQFELPGNNTLKLEDASWPFAEGKLSVRPATWAFRDGDQTFAIDVEDVDLAKLLRLTDVPNLEIDGKVSGVFPIEVRNGNIEIVGGRLKAREGGGVIRYTGPNPSPPPPPPGFIERVRQRLFGKPPLTGADLAIAALRALEYKILEITVDGRISGDLKVGVILEGANQQVLSGLPFKFNVKINVPVGQLLDNLNRIQNINNIVPGADMLQELDREMRERAKDESTTQSKVPPSVPPTPPPQP
jgi:Dicarboxylate transport